MKTKLKKTTSLLIIFALLLLAFAPVARAAFGVSFSTSIDTSVAIPDGTGTFTDFPSAPGISNGGISFLALGSGGQIGLYFKYPVDPIRLADRSTPIPGGTGNFTDFPSAPGISNGNT